MGSGGGWPAAKVQRQGGQDGSRLYNDVVTSHEGWWLIESMWEIWQLFLVNASNGDSRLDM